ncbi:hypothetical protein Glove_566g27 [Diversispora epigaea]|uniref:Uncharacterized protein n=1 Tax=Diversispora epigaea TaxID=1348612 RepID=A0A397GA08_9GLOM|nr:hypothetical protein Glove_566g27 [Diversispora epigaea]
MTGIYLCQYLSNEGKVCGRPCYRQEGCAIHWKRRQRVSCLECEEEARKDDTKIRSAWKKYIASEYTDIVQSSVTSCHKQKKSVESIDMAIDLFDGEEVYDEEYEVIDCQIHRNFPTYESCKKCGKLTISKFGACIMHVGKYRSRDHYQRKKLEKMAEKSKTFGKNT